MMNTATDSLEDVRLRFTSRCQQPGESFENFLLNLQILADACELGDLKNKSVMDGILNGVRSNPLRQRLLNEPNLSLERAINICWLEESSVVRNYASDIEISEHQIMQQIQGPIYLDFDPSKHCEQVVENVITTTVPNVLTCETMEVLSVPASKSGKKAKNGENKKCEICNKILHSAWGYTVHMRIHSGHKPHSCKYCDKTFTDSGSKLLHEKSVHWTIRPHKCKFCDKSFVRPGTLALHQTVHTGEKPFTCDTCDKRFRLRSNFKNHLKMHKRNSNNKSSKVGSVGDFKCDMCTRSYASKMSLRHHKRAHRKGKGENVKLKEYRCRVCLEHFVNIKEYHEHMTTHGDEFIHTCGVCNYVFSDRRYLLMHANKKHKDGEYKCSYCDVVSKTYTKSLNHELEHDNRHKCNICGVFFKLKESLDEHAKNHEDSADMKCKVCNMQFYYKNILEFHQESHKKVKRYQCGACNEIFEERIDMLKHMKVHI